MNRKFAVFAVVTLLAAGAVLAGQAKAPVQKVESKKVCMINEHYMNKDQIPVEVEGRTYYGCCEMCKKALSSDASKRIATDPVSGRKVDKAKAVIGADADGNVVYFENEKNLETYNRKK